MELKILAVKKQFPFVFAVDEVTIFFIRVAHNKLITKVVLHIVTVVRGV